MPALRVRPARERLPGDRPAVAAEVDDRLVEGLEVALVERLAQLALDLDAAHQLLVGALVVGLDPARGPDPWRGRPRRRRRGSASSRRPRRRIDADGDADARGHHPRRAGDVERLRERTPAPAWPRGSRRPWPSRSSQRITNSSPPKRATVSTGRTAEAIRGAIVAQQRVADLVAERVVDDLEVVEVDEQHRQRPRARGGPARARGGRTAACGWAGRSARRAAPGGAAAARTPARSIAAPRMLATDCRNERCSGVNCARLGRVGAEHAERPGVAADPHADTRCGCPARRTSPCRRSAARPAKSSMTTGSSTVSV